MITGLQITPHVSKEFKKYFRIQSAYADTYLVIKNIYSLTLQGNAYEDKKNSNDDSQMS